MSAAIRLAATIYLLGVITGLMIGLTAGNIIHTKTLQNREYGYSMDSWTHSLEYQKTLMKPQDIKLLVD